MDNKSGEPRKIFDYDSPPLHSKLIDFRRQHYYMGGQQESTEREKPKNEKRNTKSNFFVLSEEAATKAS
jgi:hypothetical protein